MEFGRGFSNMAAYHHMQEHLPQELRKRVNAFLFDEQGQDHRLKRARVEKFEPRFPIDYGLPVPFRPAPRPHDFAWMLEADAGQLRDENDEFRLLAQNGKKEVNHEIMVLAFLSMASLEGVMTAQERRQKIILHGLHVSTSRSVDTDALPVINLRPSEARKMATETMSAYLKELGDNIGSGSVLFYEPTVGPYGLYPKGFANYVRRLLFAADCDLRCASDFELQTALFEERLGPVLFWAARRTLNLDLMLKLLRWKRAMLKQSVPLLRVLVQNSGACEDILASVLDSLENGPTE